jgi:valyl-tRNA synthetase
VPDSRRVEARLVGLDDAGLGGHRAEIATLVRLDAPGEGFTPTATLDVALAAGNVHVEIDTTGAIDVAAERARLGRDLAAAQKELEQAEKKLGNPKFVEKAPADVVDGIRARHATAAADVERITARLAALPES